jgi:hypothetical protein
MYIIRYLCNTLICYTIYLDINKLCKYDWMIVLLKKKTIIMLHQNKTIISI